MAKQPTKYKGIKRIGSKGYEVRIRWKDPQTGKSRDQKRICKGSVEDAHQMQLMLLAEVVDGGGEEQHRMTLGECGTLWFKQHVAGLKPASINRYGDFLKRILASLGDHYIDALTPMDVQTFQSNELEDEYARTTVSGCVGVLRQISRFAIANRLISYDFTAGVMSKGSRKQYTVDEPNSLTVDQLRAFLDHAEKHQPPTWYVALFVLAFTGMRVGELLGLKWDDIDFGEKRITIRRTNTVGHIGAPKTHAGRRRVAMPDGLSEVLQTYRTALVEEQHPGLREGWVFAKSNGDHYHSNALSKPVQQTVDAIGLPFRFTPHGLRRTFNSMLRYIAPDRVVMDTLGHADIAMTAHYTTVYDNEKLEASTSLLELVSGTKREVRREAFSACPTCGREFTNNSNELSQEGSD